MSDIKGSFIIVYTGQGALLAQMVSTPCLISQILRLRVNYELVIKGDVTAKTLICLPGYAYKNIALLWVS